ncbi:MAG: flagellar assembly protein A [Chloroflexota bacterium]
MAETGLNYTIRVLEGGLALGLTLTSIPKLGSAEAMVKQLIGELRQRHISYGIDEAAIRDLVWNRVTGNEAVVARGAPARRGSDAEIEMLVMPPTLLPTTDDNGQVDYRNLENVKELRSGETIARKIPADPGQPGFNVFGQRIQPPRVKDAKYPVGRNVRISDDGLALVANMDGHLRWRDGCIDVLDLLTVFGDVDFRKGNVRYLGEIEVYGCVRTGFEVVAGFDAHIFGMVEGGLVASEAGSVFITGAVNGTTDRLAMVRAENDIYLSRARFASIESTSGSIIADASIEHSKLKAAKDLILRGGPALNCEVEVGGQIQVERVSGNATAAAADSSKRRESLRVDLAPPLAIVVVRHDPAGEVNGDALDISAGGMRVRLPVRMKPAEEFQMQFSLPDVPGMMWMESQILRMIETPGRKDIHAYAVRYMQIEPSVKEAITRFCVNEDLRQNRNLRDRGKAPELQAAIARRMAPPTVASAGR